MVGWDKQAKYQASEQRRNRTTLCASHNAMQVIPPMMHVTDAIGSFGRGMIHVATCGYLASEGCDATSQQATRLATETQQ